MRQIFTLGLVLACGSMALCQQSNESSRQTDVPVAAGAPAHKPTSSFSDSRERGPEYTYLYVYHHRGYVGSALAPSIYVDGKQIARVGNGRRLLMKLTPGPHNIKSDDRSSAITLDAKSGQDYFVRIDEEAGFWKGMAS